MACVALVHLFLEKPKELSNAFQWLLAYELVEPALPSVEEDAMMLYPPLLLFYLILLLRQPVPLFIEPFELGVSKLSLLEYPHHALGDPLLPLGEPFFALLEPGTARREPCLFNLNGGLDMLKLLLLDFPKLWHREWH